MPPPQPPAPPAPPASTHKQTLPTIKGAKKTRLSFYKGKKKQGHSHYATTPAAVATEKAPVSPQDRERDNKGSAYTKKSFLSTNGAKPKRSDYRLTLTKNLPPSQHQHHEQQQQQPPPPPPPQPPPASGHAEQHKANKKTSFYKTSKPTHKRISEYKVIKSPHTLTRWIKLRKKALNQGSLMNLRRLKRDGRKVPDDYRHRAMAAESPSQLSVRSISELYQLQPHTNLASVDDVFHYRGYKKLQKIDEGAFGIVSKAVRLSDKSLVAVKEVDLRRKRAKRIEEMKRELFVLQKVEDENVVKLVEHFIIDQMLVIIMEFCAGGNLTTYLKETAINEQEALFLFRQMAFSIKVLHKKGIAHRDVKLNNFLLDSSRKIVKIGDFGLSVVSYRPSVGVLMAKTYCGTEPYMAPEILKRNSLGLRSYNPLYADVWSLGVCLFAMLTRTFPFKMHTSQHGLFRAQVSRRWRFPRSLRDMLSEEIKDLVWHMLDPEPERRITINGVVAHPWLNHNQLIVLSYGESETESTHSSIR